MAQAVFGGAVTVIGALGRCRFTRALNLALISSSGGFRLDAERIERLALGIVDDPGLAAARLLAFGTPPRRNGETGRADRRPSPGRAETGRMRPRGRLARHSCPSSRSDGDRSSVLSGTWRRRRRSCRRRNCTKALYSRTCARQNRQYSFSLSRPLGARAAPAPCSPATRRPDVPCAAADPCQA